MIVRSLLVGFFLACSFPAFAADTPLYQIGPTVRAVGAGDAHLIGRSVRSEGVRGDLFALGSAVTVDDVLEGDLFSLSRTLHINGRLLDDARVIAEQVVLAGEIRGHFLSVGRTVTVLPGARVGDVSTVIGKTVELRGRFEKLVYVLGDAVALSGTYDGDVVVLARSSLTVDPGTVIRGTLRMTVRPGAAVSVPEAQPRVAGKLLSSEDWARFFLRVPLPRVRLSPFLSLWVMGMLFIFLCPCTALQLQDTIRVRFPASLLHGFLGFFVMIALILVAFLPFLLLSVLLFLTLFVVFAGTLALSPIVLASVVPAKDRGALVIHYSVGFLLFFIGIAYLPLAFFLFAPFLSSSVLGAALLTHLRSYNAQQK